MALRNLGRASAKPRRGDRKRSIELARQILERHQGGQLQDRLLERIGMQHFDGEYTQESPQSAVLGVEKLAVRGLSC